MRALGEIGLLGLNVPAHVGGKGQGMLGLAAITETLGQACPSTAMCFGMHCVATAVISAKATPEQEERYLRPIAQGEHISSLALSEPGSGSHFFLPSLSMKRERGAGSNGHAFVLNGSKSFITSGGHADSYVVSTHAEEETAEAGDFSCIVLEAGDAGIEWLEPWHGLGMRGNSSRGMRLEGVRVPAQRLLGREGDETWYLFQVVAPFFLTAMAGTYLGVAQAAFDIAVGHVRSRRHSHSGATLAQSEGVQVAIADMWQRLEAARLQIYDAARRGDMGDRQALASILMSKVAAADAAVGVTNEAMTLCGGIAYGENSTLARLLRDARASHVMAPTTAMLRLWTGRTILDLPLVQ